MAGPVDFVDQDVINGMHTAMQFGRPNDPDKVLTFWKEIDTVVEGTAVDQEGVPFDPTPGKRTVTEEQLGTDVQYSAKVGGGSTIKTEFGEIIPTSLKITLLEPEYQQVKGFDYVKSGNVKYYYRDSEPVQALGTIDVHVINVETPQEG